jgi:proteasome lid subunit RPN8/RPN11
MVAEAQFIVRIPETIYNEMVSHVVKGYPNEACGILGSVNSVVVRNYPTANAAEEPDDFSIISEEDMLAIYKLVEEYEGDMIYYHSHPQSEAYPSPRDIAYARQNGYLYLIFSHRHYPEPPYARIFAISLQGDVTEGAIELFS